MSKVVTLVIGVPGSGKSWICEQLTDHYRYIRNDDHRFDLAETIAIAARDEPRPLLADVPFGERRLKERLTNWGLEVRPVFVLEKEAVVRERYAKREGLEALDAILHRIDGLSKRCREWGAFGGTSAEVLEYLRWMD